ncbi:MAG: sodium-dependent transporter [Nitrospinales bacterium]
MNSNTQTRGFWATRMGFILAASGSAVGLGNIWKFPYITGENGGGAFVLIYLVCIFLVGLPIMLAEFTLGKKANLNPVGAFGAIKPRSPWVGIGFMGVLAGFLILSFYGVVGGWSIAYAVKSISLSVVDFSNPKEAGEFFGNFVSDPFEVTFYHAIFITICIIIVARGIDNGIEKACNFLMPILILFLFVLMIRSLTLPGAEQGVKFYLTPDFSKITPQAILLALGHAFFSLSLGMGAMITYGSYLNPKENLIYATVAIVSFDTFIALLSGLVIFPAVFAMGLEPAAGPSLVFNVLPAVFSSMPLGTFASIIFFSLLMIAALTSGISLLEVVVAFFIDQLGWSRIKAAWIMGGVIFILGVPSGLSFGIWSDVKIAGMGVFDFVDTIASNYLLPIGGMLTAIFVGWVWGINSAKVEIEKTGNKFSQAKAWGFVLRYIAPIGVAVIFIAKFMPE